MAVTAAAAAPPQPGLPYSLPGDDAAGPAAGDQTTPAMAAGGGGYLVAWTDERTTVAADGGGSGRDVYAARLDADGNLLDTTPIVISQEPGDQYDPVVAWNGTEWLVLWTGSDPYLQYATHKIDAARVSTAGEVLDPAPIPVWDGGTTAGTSGDHLFAAAGGGTDFALIVADEYVQGLGTKVRLMGLRVAPDGTVIPAAYPLYSPSCCSFFYKGGMAYTDGVYLAVFEGYFDSFSYGIFGLRLDAGLNPLDAYPLELLTILMQSETHYYRRPGVAAGNGMFYAAWNLYVSGTSSQVYGARILADGTSLDGDGVPVSGVLPVDLDLSPEPVWDGTQWRVGWSDGTLAMSRVAADGTVLDPGGVDLGLAPGPFASAGAGAVQSSWQEAAGIEPQPFDVYHAAVDAGLAVGTPACASLGAPAQVAPDLARGADGYLLCYLSATSSASRIMVQPLGPQGDALLAEPVPLAGGDVAAPRCAWNGSEYLVVWADGGSGAVHGRRLTQQGALLDAADLVLLDGDDPDAAGAGGMFLVSASRPDGVYAARLDAGGAVLDPSPLALASGGNVGPRAASLAGNFLVTWEAAGGVDGGEIALALVTPGGLTSGPFDVTTAGDGLAHHRPAIAAGDLALIVWEDDRAGDGDLYGARIEAPLGFLDPGAGFAVAQAAGDQRRPAVAWDGVEFLTVFTDDRDAVSTLDLRTDVRRDWVETNGVVAEPGGLLLLADPVPESDPVAAGAGGDGLYGSAVFDPAAPYAAYRIELLRGLLPSGVGDGTDLPRAGATLALYPNPANPQVTISYELARPGTARVDILDLSGARIRMLTAPAQAAGRHTLTWDGSDEAGRAAPSGAYLVRFRGGGAGAVDKVTLVR